MLQGKIKQGWGRIKIMGRERDESGMRQEADGSSTSIIGKISYRGEEVSKVKRKQSGRVGHAGPAGVGSQLAPLPGLKEQREERVTKPGKSQSFKGNRISANLPSTTEGPSRNFHWPSPTGSQKARGPG